MKLLFDQNLSPALAVRLGDVYPGSMHVRDAGMQSAPDEQVWRYALAHGLAIVTKDSDFQERSQIAATAPRIVGCGRTPGNVYASHRRRCRWLEFAIRISCQNSAAKETPETLYPCGSWAIYAANSPTRFREEP